MKASSARVAARQLHALRIEQRRGQWPTAFWRKVLLSLCKRMGVDHSSLRVQFRKRLSKEPEEGEASADYHASSNTIRIKPPTRVSRTSLERMFESLAHELQHAEQDHSKRLKTHVRNEAGDVGWSWEGEFFPRDSPYWDRPWEVEARAAGERYGPPMYRQMQSAGEIPLSRQEEFSSREPFQGPTIGDMGDVLSDEEFDEDILERKRDKSAWMEKWRERYLTGWRGLVITPAIGKVASAVRVAELYLGAPE